MTQRQLALGISYVISNYAENAAVCIHLLRGYLLCKNEDMRMLMKICESFIKHWPEMNIKKNLFYMQMLNPIEFNHDFSFSEPMSCVCTVRCKIQSSISHSQKKPSCFVNGCSGNTQNSKLIFFLLFYSPVRLSTKPILSAHLLITWVISGLHGPSTSTLSTRQTQSIIDFSDGFSN